MCQVGSDSRKSLQDPASQVLCTTTATEAAKQAGSELPAHDIFALMVYHPQS